MENFYQQIFNRYNVNKGTEDIDDFLKLDDDDSPYQELFNRRIYNDIRDSMEGLITLQEMTKALNEDVKGNSAPGMDGFTVDFIR